LGKKRAKDLQAGKTTVGGNWKKIRLKGYRATREKKSSCPEKKANGPNETRLKSPGQEDGRSPVKKSKAGRQ